MHKLLQRQLKRHFAGAPPDASLCPFLEAVSAAYEQSDHDRTLLEHSLDLTSQELVARNKRLREELTEHQRTAEALRASDERYQLAVRGANVGIWDWEITQGTIYFSPRWKAMLGEDEDLTLTDVEGWFARIHPEDIAAFRAALDAHLRQGTAHFEQEHRIRHRSGEYLWVITRGLALWDDAGQPYRLAGSQVDVTARRQAEEQIRHDAVHDALTQLPNRTLFMDRLNHLQAQAQRHRQQFAVLFLDLDRFKLINDSLGHLVGDQLLVEVARRLQQATRKTDTLARLGGDEFILLLENILHPEDAIHAAEQLLACFEHPFFLEGQHIYTNASIGIALSSGRHLPEELLRSADTAMYRAKGRGKGCYQIFDAHMHERAKTRLQLENDLRRALEREEFVVHYQPIYDLRSQRILGFEALARWDHPERGLLLPAAFIPVAEEIGLITQLDLWVLRQSCRQLARWRRDFAELGALTVNVNISARHFEAPGLAAAVQAALAEVGLSGHGLQLELTETALVHFSRQEVSRELQRLKDLHLRLYLDDFGTGYASLNYLHQLPFDGLKIDRSFLDGIDTDERKQAFVKTILSLAQSLHLSAVAEGIETPEELQTLQTLQTLADCAVQGWLFGHPFDSDVATGLLHQALSA
ncbi:MAG TPA: EAL domain-containing protein [Gammaproteobacteria bacterium]|nr:EAL domain-containing protein [Gammaproteobacteria bacterium]